MRPTDANSKALHGMGRLSFTYPRSFPFVWAALYMQHHATYYGSDFWWLATGSIHSSYREWYDTVDIGAGLY